MSNLVKANSLQHNLSRIIMGHVNSNIIYFSFWREYSDKKVLDRWTNYRDFFYCVLKRRNYFEEDKIKI